MVKLPSTSVIITSYNQEKTLGFLLLSLDRQTTQDFEISEGLTEADVRSGKFDRIGIHLLKSAWKKDTSSLKRGFRVSNPFLRKLFRLNCPLDILGSNLGLWKADVEKVNGFNEAMEAY